MALLPRFPKVNDKWFECYVCGLDFPYYEGIRHYRTGRLVDRRCDDEPGFSDLRPDILPEEPPNDNEQPPDTGPVEQEGLWGWGGGPAGEYGPYKPPGGGSL